MDDRLKCGCACLEPVDRRPDLAPGAPPASWQIDQPTYVACALACTYRAGQQFACLIQYLIERRCGEPHRCLLSRICCIERTACGTLDIRRCVLIGRYTCRIRNRRNSDQLI